MGQSRLVHHFQTAQAALEIQAALESVKAPDSVEREYVFYGKMEDPSQLQNAANYEDHEQWRVEIPCANKDRNMSLRIRKVVRVGKHGNGDWEGPHDPEYFLTIKSYIKGEPGTFEVEEEIPPQSGEVLLGICKEMGDGMIKRRYCFPLKGEAAERFDEENRPYWEVDAFWVPGMALRSRNWKHSRDAFRCLQPYVKLDLEVKDYNLEVTRDGSDGEYVRFELPFPLELNDVVYSQPHARTPRDVERVKKILDTYMLASPSQENLATASPGVTLETLFKNPWVSLMKVMKPSIDVNGYVFSHESRCKGRIVAVLPYRFRDGHVEYMVKSEITPCWGFDPIRSALTGGWEGGEIVEDAQKELKEESGYDVDVGEFISLGESFASKSSDTRYSLFTVDLTGKVAGETERGCAIEITASSPWLREEELLQVNDPQVHVMLNRLKHRQ